jgi:hypothetical protein
MNQLFEKSIHYLTLVFRSVRASQQSFEDFRSKVYASVDARHTEGWERWESCRSLVKPECPRAQTVDLAPMNGPVKFIAHQGSHGPPLAKPLPLHDGVLEEQEREERRRRGDVDPTWEMPRAWPVEEWT